MQVAPLPKNFARPSQNSTSAFTPHSLRKYPHWPLGRLQMFFISSQRWATAHS